MLRYVIIAVLIYLIYVIIKSFLKTKDIKGKFKNTNYNGQEISDAEFREVKPDEDKN